MAAALLYLVTAWPVLSSAAFLQPAVVVTGLENSCGVTVEVMGQQGAVETEPFNITLSVNSSLTSALVLSLRPDWSRLEVVEGGELVVAGPGEATWVVGLVADQFYLYSLELLCGEERLGSFPVPVKRGRRDTSLAAAFQKVSLAIMSMAMFMMGCEMNYTIVLAYLRRPLAPGLGMVCQYLVMPFMAYIIGLLLLTDQVWARYGLILVGSSPGGTTSNFWTMLFGGDINLSITMTFCSTMASFALTTFWLWFFARYVLSFSSSVQLPYIELFLSLGFLVVPVMLGMFLNYKKPEISKKVTKGTRPLILVILILMSTLGTYTNRYFFSAVSWYHFVAPFLLGSSGYIVGGLAAMFLRLKKEQVIALSLETAMQNVGIPILILQSNMESPYGDMALLSVLGYLITSMGPLNILVYCIYRCATAGRAWLAPESGPGAGGQQDNKAFSPDNKAFSPDNKAFSPDNKAFSPDNKASSPDNKAFSPDNKAFSPDIKAFSPDNKAFSPNNKAFSPDNQAFSPDIKAFSPDNQAFSPDNKAFPPDKMAFSTDNNAFTLEKGNVR